MERKTILFSAVDEVADRYPDFVAEIRTFLSEHRVLTGTPEASALLADRLAQDPSFGEDLLSMLRVVGAGGQEVSYLELLALLLVAAHGRESAADLSGDPDAELTARRIFNFLVDRRRGIKLDAQPSHSPPPESFGLPKGTLAYRAGLSKYAFPAQSEAEGANRDKPNAVLARALALSADEEMFGGAATPLEAERQPAPVEEAPLFGVSTATSEVTASTRSRALTWVVGLCGVVLGVLLGLLLRRSTPHTASEPLSTAQAPAASLMGAPVLRDRRGSALAFKGPSGRKPSPDRYPEAPAASDRALTLSRDVAQSPPSGPQPEPEMKAVVAPEGRASSVRVVPLLPRPASVREIKLTPPADTDYVPSVRSTRPGRVSVGSAGIMAANLMSSPAPIYPVQASAAQVQGEVVVEAIVGRDGEVVETRVISGPPLLRAAAETAVQRWRYRPYEVDGSPAEIATTARLEFKLDAE